MLATRALLAPQAPARSLRRVGPSALLLQQARLLSSLPRASGASDGLESRELRRPRPLVEPMRAAPSLIATSPVLLGLHRPSVRLNAVSLQLARGYSGWGRDPWRRNDWGSTLKTGALVALGAGALIASTSVAFGLIITGAAGYGLYTLYHKIFGPFRSGFGSSGSPFGGINSDIDRLNEMFGRDKARRSGRSHSSDLDALTQGLPFVVRGLVKGIFSMVGGAMQSSMKRAGELRSRVNDLLQSNSRVVSEMGEGVSVSTPQQWMESSVNGVGRVEAVFPVVGGAYGDVYVTVKASTGNGDSLNISEIKYRNNRTGEVIDLLRDSSSGGKRKTVIDAEYVDIDDSETRSRW